MSLSRHKEEIKFQGANIGLDVHEGSFIYHQYFVAAGGEMTMLVVPWGCTSNFALNERDWERRGTKFIQFGHLAGNRKLRLTGLVHTDEIELVWDSLKRFDNKRLGACRILKGSWVAEADLRRDT